jgi:TonB family protein
MATTVPEMLVIRIHTPGGALSELWDPASPFGVGQPLRWVLELRDSGNLLRLTDTISSTRVDQLVQPKADDDDGILAEFPLGSRSKIAIHRERAERFRSVAAEGALGTSEQNTKFRRSILQSVGALAAMLLAIPLVQSSRREVVARAPVQVVDLSKLAQSASKPKSSGGSAVTSRLRALVQGSGSRWLSKSPTSTLSGRWTDRYTASFGNMAQGNALGLSAIGRNGYSGSLRAATGGSGAPGKNWVDLDSLAATVEEGLTKDEVGQIIHKHMKEIRYCYETAMIRSPDVEGKLVVHFTIGNQGSVRSTGVRSSTVPDQRLDDCVLGRLAGWKFPNPKGGIEVAVTYPFIFKSLGK